jgi:hypothetical protein
LFILSFYVFGEIGFEPFGKFAPGKHNMPPAAFAFESDIRAETCDGPFVGAARMLFAEAQVIVELQVGEHKLEAGDWL